MKTMKQMPLVICFVAAFATANAQSGFTVDVSQLYTSFKFFDSGGNRLTDEYSGIFTCRYGIGFSYTAGFGLMIRTGVEMRNAGASMVHDNMNYSWNLKYAGAKLGLGYKLKLGRVNPYILGSGYYAYLLRGTQILNNEHFNVTELGLLNRTDYGAILSWSGPLLIGLFYRRLNIRKYFGCICIARNDRG